MANVIDEYDLQKFTKGHSVELEAIKAFITKQAPDSKLLRSVTRIDHALTWMEERRQMQERRADEAEAKRRAEAGRSQGSENKVYRLQKENERLLRMLEKALGV